MNWDHIEGNWAQLKGRLQQQWGELTDDDHAVIAGQREQLAGHLQQRYGLAPDEAERQIDQWTHTMPSDWFEKSV